MTPTPDTVLDQLRVLLGVKGCEHVADAELLRRVVERRDEAAFTVLLRRHGGRVLSVCRHVLHREVDAEDAFQATFLVFARKAPSVHKRTALASWLHGVALRCAKKLRKNAMRRSQIEKACNAQPRPESPASHAAWNELQSFLDEEIAHLPEKYRAPFLLTCLEGKSRSEAAEMLGCKEGTIASRVATAREILQKRLTARGVSLSAAMAAAIVAPADIAAGVSVSLASRTVGAALAFAAGGQGAVVPPQVLAVAQGILTGMLISKLKFGIVLVFVASIAAAAARLEGQPAVDKKPTQQFAHPPFKLQEANDQLEPKKQIGKDDFGDPLPDGAVARLGSVRFRHEGDALILAFIRDGKELVGFTSNGIVVWDATTGKTRRRLPIDIPWSGVSPVSFAVSTDGTTLALTEVDRAAKELKIGLWNLDTGAKIRSLSLPNEFDQPRQVLSLRFTAGDKSLAFLLHSRIYFIDATSGHLQVAIRPEPKQRLGNFALALDGHSVAAAITIEGDNERLQHAVNHYDARTGRLIRVLYGPEDYVNGNVQSIAFSPDGKKLAYDIKDSVCISEVASGRLLHRYENAGNPHSFVFTPDSKRLAWGHKGVRLLDVDTGKIVRELHCRDYSRCIALSPDGKTVANGTSEKLVRLWDIDSGKELFTQYQSHDFHVNEMVFSPDGRILVSSGDSEQTILWDVPTWQRIGDLPAGTRMAFSPDGKHLTTTRLNKLRVWNVTDKKETMTLMAPDSERVVAEGYTPDGARLVTLDWSPERPDDYRARRWDTATGASENAVNVPNIPGRPFWTWAPVVWGQGSNLRLVNGIKLTADGKSIVVDAKRGGISIIDVASARDRTLAVDSSQPLRTIAQTVDGRFVAAGFWKPTPGVRLWEVASGSQLFDLNGHELSVVGLAWSPNGRLVASGDVASEREESGRQTIRFWDVRTGKLLKTYGDLNSDVYSLLFSPDGNTLAAGLGNGTILIFDTTRFFPRTGAAPVLSQAELGSNWSDLASVDASKALRAVWSLVESRAQSMPLLKSQLKPVRVARAVTLDKLIADLNSTFAVREAATNQLKALGEQAEPAMRTALKADLPLETKRRLNQLLDESPGPDALRSIRAISVLERIGNAEAMSLLETLSKGAPGVRTTEEATAALARLTAKLAAKQLP